jgi:hypothetical protein
MNEPTCEQHPAICDCNFHENARRAAFINSHPAPAAGEPCSCVFNADGTVSNPCPAWHYMNDSKTVRDRLRDNSPPRCSQCGREPPLHAKDCPRIVTLSRTSAALSELASVGSDVCALLAAVQGGATLVITGPDSHARKGVPHFGASLESSDGAREAHAMGNDLPRLLRDLAQSWASDASMRQRVSPAASR